RVPATQGDLDAQFALLLQIRNRLSEAHEAVNQIRDLREQLEGWERRARRSSPPAPQSSDEPSSAASPQAASANRPSGRRATARSPQPPVPNPGRVAVGAAGGEGRADGDLQKVADAARALEERLTPIEEALIQVKAKAYEDTLNFPIMLNNKLASLMSSVASADPSPTRQQQAVFDDLSAQVGVQLDRLGEILAQDVPAFNQTLRDSSVPGLVTSGGAADER